MRYYVRAEIERFLRAVDRALERPATAVVIGGGAAALKYGIDGPTTDIDTFNPIGSDLRRAIDAARKTTGLAMPFEQAVSPMARTTSRIACCAPCPASLGSPCSCPSVTIWPS